MSGRNPLGIVSLQHYPKALRRTREVARRHGYAIGLHGSRTYDLDLIACPWADQCSAPFDLAMAIAKELGWYLHDGSKNKPHGRICYTLYSRTSCAHIDLSIMPKGSAR